MLRHSPRLTPASLAARRANALKSTGPRTDQGKARAALNPLQHGRYAVNLPDRLLRAGYPTEAAEWHAIRARIARTFEPTFGTSEPEEDGAAAGPPETAPGPSLEKKMDRLASWVWCSHRKWQQHSGAKLERRSESGGSTARVTHGSKGWMPPQMRVHNPWARLGLVFYLQRRRGWILQLLTARILGRQAPDPGPEMETGLRSKVYPLGRPRYWERIRYCIDREGIYHPEWRGPMREYRRMLRNSAMAFWLEPHPVLAGMRQAEARQEAETSANFGGGK